MVILADKQGKAIRKQWVCGILAETACTSPQVLNLGGVVRLADFDAPDLVVVATMCADTPDTRHICAQRSKTAELTRAVLYTDPRLCGLPTPLAFTTLSQNTHFCIFPHRLCTKVK